MNMFQMTDFRFHICWQRWNAWWFRDAPPHATALFRIFFGLSLLIYYAVQIPQVPMLLSREGLAIPYDLWLPENLRFLLTPLPLWGATILFALLLLSIFTLIIGCAARTSAWVVLLLTLYCNLLSFHNSSTSYNRLFLFFTFLLCISDAAGKAFSWQMWRTHGSFLAWEPGSILTQRLVTVQLTATYLGVGLQKLWLPGWEDGKVLFYSFQGMWATPLAFWFAHQQFPMWVYDGITLIVKAFEVALPFGLWIRKVRPWFFLGGLLFHAGVALFLAAIWWFFPMPLAYLLLYEPEEVAATLERLRRRILPTV